LGEIFPNVGETRRILNRCSVHKWLEGADIFYGLKIEEIIGEESD